jgi:hypothetical protein
MNLKKIMVAAAFLLWTSGACFAQAPALMSIQNNSVKCVVNNGVEDLGRFAVETIGGDPKNPLDDNKSLVFGRPVPWTSYSTLLIDDDVYVFGGQNLKIQKRAGKVVKFGEVVSQTVSSESIRTVCKFGPIQVAQILSFVKNPTTKVKDSVLISYEVLNSDSAPHKVGLRIMMDTKLGENDGAPFRMGNSAIESETMFAQAEFQDFWQAFDSLVTPNVIAQGILRSPDLGVTPPNRFYLANWGTLADNPWEFDYQQGRSFIRQGELDKDTALALFWDPISLGQNQKQVFRTVYGLGGVSMSRGALSLGLTAPSEIYESNKEHLVVGYITNAGGFDSRDTVIDFDLPPSLTLAEGKAHLEWGTLPAGYTRQVPIKVKTTRGFSGPQTITFRVKSSTFPENSISRTIDIVAPPSLAAQLRVPTSKAVTLNMFFDVAVSVVNDGNLPVDRIQVTLKPSSGVVVPEFEAPTKFIARLLPKQKETVSWKLQLNEIKGDAALSAIVKSPVTAPITLKAATTLEPPRSSIFISPSRSNLKEGDFFYIWVDSQFIQPFKHWSADIMFGPELEYIRTSPELWVVNSKQTDKLSVLPDKISIKDLDNDDARYQKRIAKFHFKAVKPGRTVINFVENGKTQLLVLDIAAQTPSESVKLKQEENLK